MQDHRAAQVLGKAFIEEGLWRGWTGLWMKRRVNLTSLGSVGTFRVTAKFVSIARWATLVASHVESKFKSVLLQPRSALSRERRSGTLKSGALHAKEKLGLTTLTS